jgi:hypothetical protein
MRQTLLQNGLDRETDRAFYCAAQSVQCSQRSAAQLCYQVCAAMHAHTHTCAQRSHLAQHSLRFTQAHTLKPTLQLSLTLGSRAEQQSRMLGAMRFLQVTHCVSAHRLQPTVCATPVRACARAAQHQRGSK